MFPCPQFITTAFPRIQQNTIILGICGLDVEASNPEDDGWFVSDYYAFNYLLHGMGSRQTWLSAVSPEELLSRYGPFFHGNPYRPRRAVLTNTLLDDAKITRPTVLPSDSMKEGVLNCLSTLSELSHQTESPLLVLAFGHRQAEDKSVLIGAYPDNLTNQAPITSLLTIDDFRQATSQAKQVGLISTACFSGGWTVIPDLNITVAAAAGEESDQSLSWPESPTSKRIYGSVFASAAICFLTDQAGMTGDMPTFNNMCRQMVDNLGTRLTRFPMHHEFTFAAYNNEYGGAWSHVSAIPVTDFEARWNALEVAPPAAPSMLDMDPGNPLCTNDEDGQHAQQALDSSATGSMRRHRPFSLRPSLFGGTFRSQTRFIQQTVAHHLTTCKGDWDMALGGKHGRILRRYLCNPCPDKAATRQALHLVEWRSGMMELADTWVAVLQLPRPEGKRTCAHWDRRLELGGQGSSAHGRMRSIFGLLREHGFVELIPETHECEFTTSGLFSCGGIQFTRPRNYMAACMALAGLQDAEVVATLERCKTILQAS